MPIAQAARKTVTHKVELELPASFFRQWFIAAIKGVGGTRTVMARVQVTKS